MNLIFLICFTIQCLPEDPTKPQVGDQAVVVVVILLMLLLLVRIFPNSLHQKFRPLQLSVFTGPQVNVVAVFVILAVFVVIAVVVVAVVFSCCCFAK